MNGYYQYAQRLAVLDHRTRHGVGARLLFIYFCGYARPESFVCPQSEDEWGEALNDQEQRLGLPDRHCLSGSIHKLFLPVRGE